MNEIKITLSLSDDLFYEIPFEPKSMQLSELIKIIGDRPVSALSKSINRDPIFSNGNHPVAFLTGGGKIEFLG